MNVATAINLIQYRLDEDPSDPKRYTDVIVAAALNDVHAEIAGSVVSGLLNPLQKSKNITVQATGYALSNVTNYFRYVNSQLYLVSSGGWITKIEGEALGVTDSSFMTGKDYDPLCYIWDDVYYLLVTTYSDNYNKVKLFYLEEPATIASDSTNFQIDMVLHGPMLRIAEAALRGTYKHGDPSLTAEFKASAWAKIEELNQKYMAGEILK